MADTRRELSALQTLFADNTSGAITAQDGRDELVSTHGSNVIQSTTFGSLPASPITGDLAYTEFYVLRYNGSIWVPIAPNCQFIDPTLQTWSWVNQGGATVDVTKGAIHLFAPAGSGSNLRMRVASAPGSAYTRKCSYLQRSRDLNTSQAGVVCRESSSGKIIAFTTNYGSRWGYDIYKFTNPTTFSSNPFDEADMGASPGKLIHLMIEDDQTNLNFYISADGQNYGAAVYSEARGTFFTGTGHPDQVGPYANPENSTYGVGMTVVSFG